MRRWDWQSWSHLLIACFMSVFAFYMVQWRPLGNELLRSQQEYAWLQKEKKVLLQKRLELDRLSLGISQLQEQKKAFLQTLTPVGSDPQFLLDTYGARLKESVTKSSLGSLRVYSSSDIQESELEEDSHYFAVTVEGRFEELVRFLHHFSQQPRMLPITVSSLSLSSSTQGLLVLEMSVVLWASLENERIVGP